jgi:hypothetical protein
VRRTLDWAHDEMSKRRPAPGAGLSEIRTYHLENVARYEAVGSEYWAARERRYVSQVEERMNVPKAEI